MTTSQEMMQRRHFQCLLRNALPWRISNSPQVTLGTRGVEALLGPLSEGSRLKMLDSTDNMFGTKGGDLPREIISGHLGLTEVYFGRMNLKDEGVIAIADSLKEAAPSPRLLMIGENNITSKAGDNKLKDDGSIIICKAISRGHEQLKVLDLRENVMILIGAKADVGAVANKPDFSRLFLGENFITNNEIKILHFEVTVNTTTDFDVKLIWKVLENKANSS
ncbi:hypothetical protein SUGI_0668590 [Cryptomeria japonica]|nr:hypothetical protein SUGI_0668300 [Cryptomeria japonica]GLJ33224.1 hypothetical protein SUGI_0668590 [Cryptomeria japonica]